jgi:hypothetical protein
MVKMKKGWRTFWIVSGIIAAILVVKAVLFFTAKPKVTVDYVAEYNRITRPENYDPNDNAAPYYQKAFDAFVEMPRELQEVPYIIGWPTDLNSTEQAKLEEWLASNQQAFEYFKIAANKPYYWIERHAGKDGGMISLESPRQLIIALLWNARLEAYRGQLQTAFENIIDCYRAGRQKCLITSFLYEQQVGLDIKRDAVLSALVILDRTQVDNTNLKIFQEALQTELNNDTYVPDFTVDNLFCYDWLQRSFVHNDSGNGRLAFCKIKDFLTLCGEEYNRRVVLSCFVGPTESEMVKRIEELFASFEPVRTETPWQIHAREPGYFERIDITCYNNVFLGLFAPDPSRIFQSYHRTKARGQALITAIAIVRFRTDNGRFPVTLDELVSTGYLKSVPTDPYSDGPLVYKPAEDNFKLYSVGEDFSDDNGAIKVETKEAPHRDILFWPVRRYERRLKTYIGEPNKLSQD